MDVLGDDEKAVSGSISNKWNINIRKSIVVLCDINIRKSNDIQWIVLEPRVVRVDTIEVLEDADHETIGLHQWTEMTLMIMDNIIIPLIIVRWVGFISGVKFSHNITHNQLRIHLKNNLMYIFR